MPPPVSLSDCWAKTNLRDAGESRPVRSVLEHSIQAGAVAQALRASIHPLVPMPDGIGALTALHDIGKIAAAFLWKCPAWQKLLLPSVREWLAERRVQDSSGRFRHAHRSLGILTEAGLGQGRNIWARAAGGHHGRFVDGNEDLHHELEAWAGPARYELLRISSELFGALPEESVRPKAPDKLERLLIATGFMIVCDWLASDEELFPLGSPDDFGKEENAAQLLAEAQPLAEAAVRRRLQWHTGALRSGVPFEQFAAVPSANGLQRAVMGHVHSPGLYLMEAPMGMGKTEAAMAAAYQIIAAGKARGFYFALPTRLTSDRIHHRLAQMMSRLLETPLEMPVVHAAAWLREPAEFHIQPGDSDDGLDATAVATWFTSRRALLARYGVGTVDQALMATLPVKFCALRAFGLAGKVVILDEVHTYDSYTGTVLDILAARLLRMGCTVLVLSATLTRARKAALLKECGGELPPEDGDEPYPLLTCFRPGEPVLPVEVKTEPRETNPRTVALRHIEMETPLLPPDVQDKIAARARDGACVLIIRNTVALAQETFRQLSGAVCDGIEKGLLHSRTPYFIRNGRLGSKDNGREDLWVNRLGKDRAQRPANGCIVVSTQVCEQSLDIDADLLISDLCPGDALFQRLGRLFRHKTPRSKSATAPEAWLLHPKLPADECEDAKTWKDALKPHGNIYAPSILLRTHRHWRPRSSVALPDDIRSWLEAIYDENQPLPPAWCELETECQTEAVRLRAFAEGFANNPAHRPATTDNEAHVPTRWNERPEREVVLLAARPRVLSGGSVRVYFLDGSAATFSISEPWQRLKAVAVFINSVRVPFYTASGAPTPWLRPYSSSAPLALWMDDKGCLCRCDDDAESGLWFTETLGLFHQPARTELPHDDASILDLEIARDEESMM